MPPVARMTAVFLCFINASVPSSAERVKHWTESGGRPSLTPASRIRRAVSAMHLTAEGCGERTMAFLDLMVMRILKIAVDVGLVEGMIPATTPRGLAISTTEPLSLTTPTVFNDLKWFQTSSAAKRFFSRLSSGRPKPVSSLAILPSLSASASAARDIASQIRSTVA